MAEARTPAVMPLQFLKQEADGYCDPVSGVCARSGLPGEPPTPTQRVDPAPGV